MKVANITSDIRRKPSAVIFANILVLAFAAFASLMAIAKVPEPDTIICGTLRQMGGLAVKSSEDHTIQVQALVDDVVLASADVSSTTNTFVLRIPMDDGIAPRIAGTAKSSDLVRVRVMNVSEGTTIETAETQIQAIEIPAERGSVLSIDFRVDGAVLGDDQDGDGIPDSWESQYTTSSFAGVRALSLAANDSQLDNDGDGFTNYEEFVAGTNPLDKSSTFAVTKMEVGLDAVALEFGPITADRIYSLLYKPDLSVKEWTIVDQYRPVDDQAEATWEAALGSGNGGFYRLRVEIVK